MSTSVKLDKECDIVFDDTGIAEIVSEEDDVIQSIRIELEQNKRQYALNIKFGTPYLNEDNTGLLQAKNNKENILSEIRKTINKHKGVEILELDFIDKRIVAKMRINGKEVYL